MDKDYGINNMNGISDREEIDLSINRLNVLSKKRNKFSLNNLNGFTESDDIIFSLTDLNGMSGGGSSPGPKT